jgi:hypothetical protein
LVDFFMTFGGSDGLTALVRPKFESNPIKYGLRIITYRPNWLHKMRFYAYSIWRLVNVRIELKEVN